MIWDLDIVPCESQYFPMRRAEKGKRSRDSWRDER